MSTPDSHLTGKELLFAALRHEPLPAVPWVPFAGVHSGLLKGYSALEVLQDGQKLFELIVEANRVYSPDGQPVGFDLQVEAEILDCHLVWTTHGPPSVASHPLESTLVVPTRLPEPCDGRLPMILDVMRRIKAKLGHDTALYGLITGPMTLASHLRGTEIFMDTFDHSEYLAELLDYCVKVSIRMAELYREAGMDVIAVVDPVVSQVSPRHFKQFLLEPFTRNLRCHSPDGGFFLVLCVRGCDQEHRDDVPERAGLDFRG